MIDMLVMVERMLQDLLIDQVWVVGAVTLPTYAFIKAFLAWFLSPV
jgi:hypothetical protein